MTDAAWLGRGKGRRAANSGSTFDQEGTGEEGGRKKENAIAYALGEAHIQGHGFYTVPFIPA